MRAAFRLSPLLFIVCLFAVPGLRAQDEEPIPGVMLENDYASFEYRVIGAFGSDADELEKREGRLPPFDPAAEAMKRGDFVRAYAEIGRTVDADDRVLVRRGDARAAWLLARLGVSHYAVDRANLGLPEPTAQGEVLLARAWLLWHVGEFAWAEKEEALAARARHPAPAWALAEFARYRAAHAQAAAAVAAVEAPAPAATAEFLAHADRLLAAGAINRADWCYDAIETKVRDAGAAATPAERALAVKAVIGLRETLLAAWGGRMPGPDYSGVRLVMLERARAAAVAAGSSRAEWEKFLAMAVEAQADARTADWAELDVPGAVALAERQAGVDPVWRERLKPLLADPRLRYASRLATTLARCRAHLGFGVTPEIADEAKFREFLALLEEEKKILAGLRAQVPAGAAPLIDDNKLAQLDALAQLRLALREGRLEEARRHFVRFDELDSFFGAERDDLLGAIDRAEREAFFSEVAGVEVELEFLDLKEADLTAAAAMAERIAARLRAGAWDGTVFGRIENSTPEERDTISHILHLRTLVAAKSGRLIPTAQALAELEKWCAQKSVPEFRYLESARVAVASLPMEDDKFIGREAEIMKAVKDDRVETGMVAEVQAAIAATPDRLAPRLLLPLVCWRVVDDKGAAEAVAELRRLVPTVHTLHTALDRLVENNDSERVCTQLAAELRRGDPAARATAIKTARGTADSYINRVRRVHNGGEVFDVRKLSGQPYLVAVRAIELFGQAQAAAGDLRGALLTLDTLRGASAATQYQRLRAVVEQMPFRHDLPDDATRAAWRTLIEDRVVKGDELKALHEVLKPWEGKSITARLSFSLFLFRTTKFDKAVEDLNALREVFGVNRDVARQVDHMIALAREWESNRTVLLFGRQDSIMEERRNLQRELSNFVDANRDALAEVYSRDGHSNLTRHVDYLEARIKELGEQAQAEERKDIDAQNRRSNANKRAMTEAFAALQRLTL